MYSRWRVGGAGPDPPKPQTGIAATVLAALGSTLVYIVYFESPPSLARSAFAILVGLICIVALFVMTEPFHGRRFFPPVKPAHKPRYFVAIVGLSVVFVALAVTSLMFPRPVAAPDRVVVQSGPSRGKYLSGLQERYTKGMAIWMHLDSRMTNAQLDRLFSEANDWHNEAQGWIGDHMGAAAETKFNDSTGWFERESGFEHRATVQANEGHIIENAMGAELQNIQTLMSSPDFDPAESSKP